VNLCINRLCLIGLILVGLGACASAPTELVVEEQEWVYEVRAINMLIRAASDVNSVSGRPHSIALGIFQMNDPNTFSALAVDQAGPEGAFELLQKGKVDDTIVNFQLISMRPGEQKKISISRAQTAKYIGVIAGYFKLNPKTDVKIFEIPVRAIKRGIVEDALAFATLISDEAKAIPDKLSIFVDLGRTGTKQIVTLGGKGGDVAKKEKKKEKAAEESWFGVLKTVGGKASQASDLVE
jgi:type VI secretion system VasD/TssJ family lipoprotein